MGGSIKAVIGTGDCIFLNRISAANALLKLYWSRTSRNEAIGSKTFKNIVLRPRHQSRPLSISVVHYQQFCVTIQGTYDDKIPR